MFPLTDYKEGRATHFPYLVYGRIMNAAVAKYVADVAPLAHYR